MDTPPINSFGAEPRIGSEPPTPDRLQEADEQLTVGRLNEILTAFKGSVEHALARQEAAFEARLATVEFPDMRTGSSGVLDPGDDLRAADSFDRHHFSAAADQAVSTPEPNRYTGQRLVKSTVNIPEGLHAKLKRHQVEQGVGAGLSLQTQLTIAIEEYLAKRGL
jgi:hypothetical protein